MNPIISPYPYHAEPAAFYLRDLRALREVRCASVLNRLP